MIEVGNKFPNETDYARIQQENVYELMLNGEYSYNKTVSNNGTVVKLDPLVPIAGTISEINGDLLFGREPAFSFKKQSDVKKVLQFVDTYQSWDRDLLEAATYSSALGTVFIYMFKVHDQLLYKYLLPNQILWEQGLLGIINFKIFTVNADATTSHKITYDILEYRFEFDEATYRGPLFDPNRQLQLLEYQVITNRQTRKVVKVSEPFITELEWDFIPIVKIENIGVMRSETGKSDYNGLGQLLAEVDNRIDQINTVVDKFSEPWVAVPPGLVDSNGNFNQAQGKMYQKTGASGGKDEISVAVWDAQLEAGFKAIETMIQLIFFSARISPAISGWNDKIGGQSESGRALRWRSISTLAMIKRKRKYWEGAFKQFFEYASIMSPELKGIDTQSMTVVWKDPLPVDTTEVVENVVKKVRENIISRVSAIQQTEGISKEAAEAELEQIKAEQVEINKVGQEPDLNNI